MIHYIDGKSIIVESNNNREKLIIIIFCADWCAPCEEQIDIYAAVEKMYADEVEVYKVNVDGDVDIKMRYNVSSLPLSLFLKDGNEIERKTGLLKFDDIIKIIEELK